MTKYIFTCEHGGNKIPKEYNELFKTHRTLLESHRGYDLGILDIYKPFIKKFNEESHFTEISRLLIEFNRSLHNRNLFSEITKGLDIEIRNAIIDKYYQPYRKEVKDSIEKLLKNNNRVIHISFHSFTPRLNGVIRTADIGLLYDPKSNEEREFCKHWKNSILKHNPKLKVRFNYPYLGIADGFTSYLRKKLKTNKYSGIELEVNQKLLSSKFDKSQITDLLINSFRETKNMF